MSDPAEPEAAAHDAAHAAAAHHVDFDPEPIRELPPDEPRSPMWLPLVGLGLLAAGGLWLGLRTGALDSAAAPAATATASAGATAAPRPATTMIPRPGGTVLPTPRSTATAVPSGALPSKSDIDRLREQMRKAIESRKDK
jgi:hypothetical protein